MELGKAKTILIALFAALNVFLLVNIFIYPTNKVSEKTISHAVQTLEQRGIKVDCTIPRTATDPGRLAFSAYKFDIKKTAAIFMDKVNISETADYNQKITQGAKTLTFMQENYLVYSDSNPQSSINISQKSEIIKYIKGIINKLGLDPEEYVLDSYSLRNGKVQAVYYEKYKDYLVYDSFIKVSISGKGLTSLECEVRNPTEMAVSKNKKIISAYQILLKDYIQAGKLTITGIDMGYKEYSREEGSREIYSGPVWRISSSDGSVHYFSIYDGQTVF